MESTVRARWPADWAWLAPAVVTGVGLGLLFWPLASAFAISREADEGLAFFAPLVAAALVWIRRDTLRETPAAGDARGWWLIGLGCLIAIAAHRVGSRFPLAVALPLVLAGMVWYLRGRAWLGQLWFPLLILAAITPLPSPLVKAIAFPLQAIIARLAAIVLEVVGLPVQREGVMLVVAGHPLQVAEGCSGWRGLSAAFWLSLIFVYWQHPSRWWQSLWVLPLLLPLAMVANLARVVTVGILTAHGQAWAVQAPWHELIGIAYFVPSVWLVLQVAGPEEIPGADTAPDDPTLDSAGEQAPTEVGATPAPGSASAAAPDAPAAVPAPTADGPTPPPAGLQPVRRESLWRLAVACCLLGGVATICTLQANQPQGPTRLPDLPPRLGEWQRDRTKPQAAMLAGGWQEDATYRNAAGEVVWVFWQLPVTKHGQPFRMVNLWLKRAYELIGERQQWIETRYRRTPVRVATLVKGRERAIAAVTHLHPRRATVSDLGARLWLLEERLLRGRVRPWVTVSVTAGDAATALAVERLLIEHTEDWLREGQR